MKNCALVLALLVALGGFVSEAQAGSVNIGYSVTGTFGIPGLGVPAIGPPVAGTAIINFRDASTGPISSFGGFGAFSPIHAAAKLQVMSLAIPVSFSLFGGGALITAPAPLLGGFAKAPGINTLASTGGLVLNVAGGASGLVHCTGGFCGGLVPFPPSVLTPFGFAAAGALAGVAATPGSSLLPSFALAGSIGTILGVPLTAMLTFTEAPLFGGGASRHLVPEPGTIALAGLGLLGMAAAGRRLLRR